MERKPLYLYDLPPEVLSTLTLKADATLSAQLDHETYNTSRRQSVASVASDGSSAGGSQSCSLCSMAFTTVQEQRDHLKTDLHHYNLKQKLNGLTPVTESEFEKLVGELDESISGSDSADSEEDEESARKETTLSALLKKQATLVDKQRGSNDGDAEGSSKRTRGAGNQPLLWFGSPTLPEKTYYGIYKAIFTPAELGKEDSIVDAIKTRQLEKVSMGKPPKDASSIPATYNGRHIFMCMIGGGHFAAMVVSLSPKKTKHSSTGPMNREAVVLVHKTFHRYTTRRKQGGSQSANDNAKGAAHSAGASIRRYNEQALIEDVRGVLSEWKGLIESCDLLFIRATGNTNRRTLFGPYEGQVLRSNDPRIRSFPFNTRRATQNELMRAFIELTRLKVQHIDPAAIPVPAEPAPPKPKAPSKPAAPKLSEEEETALLHTTQLQALIRRSKLPALLSYLKTNDLDASTFRFHPADTQQNHHAPTVLHLAAAQNSAPLVSGLLTRANADPTQPNADGKTPFDLAGDRATRDTFRVARSELGEAAWDWDAARVPAALKREESDQRAERERKEEEAKERERRKAEEQRLEREGPKVVGGGGGAARRNILSGGKPMTAQEKREEEARGLTPEGRMRLDRERRARAAEERMRRLQGS